MPEVCDALLMDRGAGKPPLDLAHAKEFVRRYERQKCGDNEENEWAACQKAPHVGPHKMNAGISVLGPRGLTIWRSAARAGERSEQREVSAATPG
jgi:hypothetical protein